MGRGKQFPLFCISFQEENVNPEETQKARSIEVRVNGKEIALNPFATHILGNTIWAMITSLRLEDRPEKVEIELSE